MTITRFGMTPKAIEELINRRVEEALVAYEEARAANALKAENQSQNGTDGGNGNGKNRTVETDTAFAMSRRELMKLIVEVYCLRNEVQKMESELWNLTVKNNDLAAYTQRFQELTMLCTRMVHEEEDRIKRYVGGLPDNIQGNVMSAEPTRLQDAIRLANNEVLIVQGDRGEKGEKSKLSIISCTKTQKYIKRGCLIFMAQVTKKETVDKSKEKRLEDVLIVRDFSKVFPKDFPGLPPTRQVEFQIDLVPGAAPIARTPYRLAPSKLQELSTQLQELSDKGFIRPSSSSWGALSEEEHAEHLNLILELLKKEELYAKFSKCDFWLSRVQFLGHVIVSKVIYMDPAMIDSIKDWASPKTSTEIHQFLEVAFQLLKQKLCSAPILALLKGKANVVADALSRKQQNKPLQVRTLVMTIGLNLPVQLLNAQFRAIKDENFGTEDLCGMIKKVEQRIDGKLCLNGRSWIPC
uniref:Reverse transcriptase domain-containing protein n=1 Tax=Tanacetum cinerariifolium TaxID=118510 RepID=A0A699H317_TANCI|nr:reverse transcriptase domain-containing protein [Tanacetum cinerariifolium]